MIRGTKRKVTGQKGALNIDLPVNIHNRFDIEVIDAKSGEVKQRAKAFNVITNNLWSNLAAKKAYFNYIHYGTGSGTPSSEDTQLFSFYGALAVSSSNLSLNIDFDNHFISYRNYIQLSPETAVGQTITEVGIGQSATASTLCTHAMLQDMNGNQISILKSDTDIINIYATVFVHWSPADNGVEFMYTEAFADITKRKSLYTLTDALAGVLNFPSYVRAYLYDIPYTFWGDTDSPVAPNAYYNVQVSVSNNMVSFSFPRVDVNSCNFSSGIHRIYICTQVPYSNSTAYVPEFAIYPPSTGAPSTTIKGEAIGTGDGGTVNFKTKFGYAKNATIYVDGVASSGVTIDPNSPATENINRFLKLIPKLSDNYYNCFIDSTTATYHYSSPLFDLKSGEKGIQTWYNPNWSYGWGDYGLKTIYNPSELFELSDDLINWSPLTGASNLQGQNSFPEELRHKKYIRVNARDATPLLALRPYDIENAVYNIHFETPPAAGAVITADYTTDVLAKDENHVFDLSITAQLGEYTK